MLEVSLSKRTVVHELYANKSVISSLWLRFQATSCVAQRHTSRTRTANNIEDPFIRLQEH